MLRDSLSLSSMIANYWVIQSIIWVKSNSLCILKDTWVLAGTQTPILYAWNNCSRYMNLLCTKCICTCTISRMSCKQCTYEAYVKNPGIDMVQWMSETHLLKSQSVKKKKNMQFESLCNSFVTAQFAWSSTDIKRVASIQSAFSCNQLDHCSRPTTLLSSNC